MTGLTCHKASIIISINAIASFTGRIIQTTRIIWTTITIIRASTIRTRLTWIMTLFTVFWSVIEITFITKTSLKIIQLTMISCWTCSTWCLGITSCTGLASIMARRTFRLIYFIKTFLARASWTISVSIIIVTTWKAIRRIRTSETSLTAEVTVDQYTYSSCTNIKISIITRTHISFHSSKIVIGAF